MPGVSSYSPELMKFFEIGSQREFVFDCKSRKLAHALRWKIYCLRRDMRAENHPLLPLAEATIFTIKKDRNEGPDNTGHLLVAHPPDNEYIDELRSAISEAEKDMPRDSGVVKELLDREEVHIEPKQPKSINTLPRTSLSENAIDNYLKKRNE